MKRHLYKLYYTFKAESFTFVKVGCQKFNVFCFSFLGTILCDETNIQSLFPFLSNSNSNHRQHGQILWLNPTAFSSADMAWTSKKDHLCPSRTRCTWRNFTDGRVMARTDVSTFSIPKSCSASLGGLWTNSTCSFSVREPR